MQIPAVMNTYLRAQVFVRGFCQIALLSESVSLESRGLHSQPLWAGVSFQSELCVCLVLNRECCPVTDPISPSSLVL